MYYPQAEDTQVRGPGCSLVASPVTSNVPPTVLVPASLNLFWCSLSQSAPPPPSTRVTKVEFLFVSLVLSCMLQISSLSCSWSGFEMLKSDPTFSEFPLFEVSVPAPFPFSPWLTLRWAESLVLRVFLGIFPLLETLLTLCHLTTIHIYSKFLLNVTSPRKPPQVPFPCALLCQSTPSCFLSRTFYPSY